MWKIIRKMTSMTKQTKKLNFKGILGVFNLFGLNPFNKKYLTLKFLFVSLCFFPTIIFSNAEYLINFHNRQTAVKGTEIFIPQIQIICKLIMLLYHGNDIARVIEKTKNFWPLKRFGLEYLGGIILFTIQYMLTPLIRDGGESSILLYGETKKNVPYYKLQLISQSLYGAIILVITLGSEGLYLYLAGHAITELRMIGVAMSKRNDERWWTNIFEKEVISHHQDVLEYINLISDIFSNMLFYQYFTSLFGICFGIFFMVIDGMPPDSQHLIKYVPYLASFLTQMWMYCFIGSIIISEVNLCNVAHGIFYIDWNKDEAYRDKFGTIMIIRRAQKAARIKIGDVLTLDLECFTSIFSNGLSFLTFINAVFTREH